MSGFEFYIQCSNCGLSSPVYPFQHDETAAPPTVVLPVLDRERQEFGELRIPVAGRMASDELAATASEHSTPTITVAVPHLMNTGVRLEPQAACPRCGRESLVGHHGRPPTPRLQVATVADLIELTRSLEHGNSIEVAIHAPPALVICMRDESEELYRWHVERIAGSEIDAIVGDLITQLTASGSTCSAPRRLRAFVRFDEQLTP